MYKDNNNQSTTCKQHKGAFVIDIIRMRWGEVIDWLKIRNEYINTSISQRKLAEKYKISFPTLRDRAKKENWNSDKKNQRDKIVTKTSQKIAEKIVQSEVSQLEDILITNSNLKQQVDKAIKQLTTHVDMFGKVHDSGKINVSDLRKLVSTLRDIKEIVGVGDGDGGKNEDKVADKLCEVFGNANE